MHAAHSARLASRASVAAVAVAVVAALAAGCGGGETPAINVPVAVLACPKDAAAGVAFLVDGSASLDAGGASFTTVALTVEPGSQSASTLSSSFTLPSGGVATARLVVTDAQKRTAEARCRFTVSGPSTPPVPAVDSTGTFALVGWDLEHLHGGALDPQDQCGAAPELSLVTLVEEAGAHVTMTVQPCTLAMAPIQALGFGVQHFTIPEAALDKLVPLGPVQFDLTGDSFAPPLDALTVPEILGAAPVDPYGPLPTSDDGHLRDDDGDGQPAVTLAINDGSQDVVLRHAFAGLSGKVISSDEIDGTDAGDLLVHADSAVLNPLDLLQPESEGLPSVWKMVRVAAGTCADLREQKDALVAQLQQPALPDGCATFP